MADVPISGLTALSAAPAAADLLATVDVSDTSQAPTGTTKKITIARLFTTPTITTSAAIAGGTVTTSTPMLDAAQTWNAAGEAFTGIKVDITNTASAAASKIVDLQVGGLSVLSVGKAGTLAMLGDLAINTNKFTVAGASGNTIIGGSLSHAGSDWLVGTSSSHAVSFVMNGSPRWQIATTGNLLPAADDTYDVGATATRARNIYANRIIATSGTLGIGTLAPVTSAALEIVSTTGALLPPRMTTTQRDALTPVNGMILYNSTANQLQGYVGGSWASLT